MLMYVHMYIVTFIHLKKITIVLDSVFTFNFVFLFTTWVF
uniref:Uncharacterized protein n=1 Tax=Anguilla anguilla TaxID=7936 RepID=A0A0E9SRK9_ANGAN